MNITKILKTRNPAIRKIIMVEMYKTQNQVIIVGLKIKRRKGDKREQKREHVVEKAYKRKARQKLNKKMGNLGFPAKKKNRSGPPPPTRSVCFVDNTANGTLVKRMQECELELGEVTDLRVRMTEAAGTPLSL